MYNGYPPQGFHPQQQQQGQYPPFMPPQNGQGPPPGFMPMRPGMPMPTLPPQNGPGGGFPPPFASQDPRFRPAMPPFAPTGSMAPSGGQPPQMNMGLSPNANGLVQIPNASPAAQSPATPMGFSNPLIGRPPPQGFGMRPAPGLGFNGQGQGQGQGPPGGPGFMIDHNAAGLPRPPHMMFPGAGGQQQHQHPQYGMGGSDNPNFVKPAVKTTAVFIGGIPDGITDAILTGLIQVRANNPACSNSRETCGPLVKINRPTGKAGKPQAFGFAEFEDPEVVLRCLKCLQGVELPDITPQGRQQGTKKQLVVKADEKTRAFLDEFEQLNLRTDHDDELDTSAVRRIGNIVRALQDPSADLAAIIGESAAPDVKEEDKQKDVYVVPDHLRDLDESELPENQRNVVMGQIASFREASARRDAEKKRQDENMEARRQASAMQGDGAAYGRPGANNGQQMRQWGSSSGPNHQGQQMRPIGNGPQSYNQPVGFVKAETAEAKPETERTDEEAERMRLEEQQRQKGHMLRERERRIESKERQHFQRLGQELAILQQDEEMEKADREAMRKELARYDDDYFAETGRDAFYADRSKWRSERQRPRRQEYQDDVRDRQREADEQAALEKETEDLFKRQMHEMADIEAKGRAAGLLFEDAKPIKVAIGAPAPLLPLGANASTAASSSVASVKTESKPKIVAARGNAASAFGAEDDEEDVKKKRTLVRLDEDAGEKSSIEAKTQAKLTEIRNGIPKSPAELWSLKLRWEGLNPPILGKKVFPVVRQKLVSILGDLEIDELFNFVVEHVQQHASPRTIVEGLEPVLDEEAEPLVVLLWRALAFESAAFAAGLDTGSMQI
ncbi:hypothetical protein QFC21_000076 [Naganishia friedmannii]|uniref:Uncharacterized protein n=1 Tax=Naganishia friedmannii TaxID=89922 RepID=A0ACC2WBG6_9TREE|nr:hypothetical protein QFC21_000076 [Naganishia friedmannii]